MSGFLRRLAAQAMGTSKPVRTAVRLPFAPPPVLAERAPASEKPSSPVLEDSPSAAAENPVFSRGPTRPLDTPPPAPDRKASEMPIAGPRSSEEFDVVGLQAVEMHRPVPTAHDELPSAPVESDSEPVMHYTLNSAASGFAQGRGRPALSQAAEPLLPPQRVAPMRAADIRPPESLIRPVSENHGEETTEVHVTIGRIEITAVHPPPAPKRPSAAEKKPMSLDEYLAGRHRSRK